MHDWHVVKHRITLRMYGPWDSKQACEAWVKRRSVPSDWEIIKISPPMAVAR
jgi:hypothetical protein